MDIHDKIYKAEKKFHRELLDLISRIDGLKELIEKLKVVNQLEGAIPSRARSIDVGGGKYLMSSKLAYLPETQKMIDDDLAKLENFKEQLLRVEKYFKENFIP